MPYFTQRSYSQKKVSLMHFVTKSSVSGELNYFSLLLYGKHFERLPLTLCKAKEGKKKIEDALQTFHMVRQVPHLPYSCWTHFKVPFQEEDKKIQGAASVLGETLPLSSPQSWECMLLFNKPRTRLLAHKQRRRCIIHFGGVAEGQSVSDAQPVPSHENISPPNSVSSKFKDKQTELSSTSCTVRGWETVFNRQLHDSRKTQTRWTRGTKAKMSLCL